MAAAPLHFSKTGRLQLITNFPIAFNKTVWLHLITKFLTAFRKTRQLTATINESDNTFFVRTFINEIGDTSW